MSSSKITKRVREEQAVKPINYSDPALVNITEYSGEDNYKENDKDKVKFKDKNQVRDNYNYKDSYKDNTNDNYN